MAEAVRAGVKTHTRRLAARELPPDATEVYAWWGGEPGPGMGDETSDRKPGLYANTPDGAVFCGPCRYGAPGDAYIFCEGLKRLTGGVVGYADGTPARRDGHIVKWTWKPAGLPPRYMPSWAARTLAVCRSIRLARLRDIDEETARAEGAVYWWTQTTGHPESMLHAPPNCTRDTYAVACFRELFNSIHAGKEAWKANPYVWDIGFEAVASC